MDKLDSFYAWNSTWHKTHLLLTLLKTFKFFSACVVQRYECCQKYHHNFQNCCCSSRLHFHCEIPFTPEWYSNILFFVLILIYTLLSLFSSWIVAIIICLYSVLFSFWSCLFPGHKYVYYEGAVSSSTSTLAWVWVTSEYPPCLSRSISLFDGYTPIIHSRLPQLIQYETEILPRLIFFLSFLFKFSCWFCLFLTLTIHSL